MIGIGSEKKYFKGECNYHKILQWSKNIFDIMQLLRNIAFGWSNKAFCKLHRGKFCDAPAQSTTRRAAVLVLRFCLHVSVYTIIYLVS